MGHTPFGSLRNPRSWSVTHFPYLFSLKIWLLAHPPPPSLYSESMRTHVAPRRDFHGLELRRQHAARLFAAGEETQAAIARRLGVSRQSVMRWYQAWRTGGHPALRAAGRAGRKPRLAPEQLPRIEAALREGPRAHGFRTNLWTLPRVARLIQNPTGVQYHPGMSGASWARSTGPCSGRLPAPKSGTSQRSRTGSARARLR
jgi:transposase